MSRSRREVEWADGIRGIASLLIVTSHLVRAFIPNYLDPADDWDAPPHLFQRPFLRIIAAGPFWISIFFLLSGYVCAFKPIRLCNAGQVDEARRVIASSAFRRVFRIGVPATILTFLVWVLCQMGAFELVGPREFWADWLPYTTPRPVAGFFPAIRSLLRECFNTWAWATNLYEGNMWTLSWEMYGSMVVFLVLNITAACKPFWRRVILVSLAWYYFKAAYFLCQFMFISGALLAEISLVMNATKTGGAKPFTPHIHGESVLTWWAREYWPLGTAMLGFFLGSMPPGNQPFAWWSRVVYYFFEDYITTEWGETDRTIGAVAGIIMLLSVLYSPLLRSLFSHHIPVFLGSISYGMYLLHGTFIRLPLAWLLFKFLAQYRSLEVIHIVPRWDDDDIEVITLGCHSIGCKLVVGITLILWFMALLTTCKLWKKHVDVLGIRFSRWLEEIVLGKKELPDIVAAVNLLGEIPRPSWMMTDPEKFSYRMMKMGDEIYG